ncbi:MAG: hypothetical protein COZ16_05675 [Flavobacteriaceae bacterium CG_4_10_14_3_um_filter_31_253]|nr:MAG: hypothetical protein AUK46_08175 [Flavobacteriaceae bacterium CG2_30_31_66]PIV96452.1 MAG: hypothetical protein COW43_08020 [Flavobacteriaceae bacterium CG17_big_fil_post_rev_8_21_14_2_50_31_13]PIX14554.1 MAG: hypothetical protein COZ74_02665 [Flavobacteriaceae bacterium CG_4_8_14_3_um_filter_31_8]PIY15073.1 MAG: hypothetical protein COZ16_05675 [Flavobacteriaceae bacterium CG_4_10_14_3_um_filter_31_253]PIZ09713.1 MAG: hypothetical protein COY55_11310 [Flavobacteriaceae bacterium CG_4_1
MKIIFDIYLKIKIKMREIIIKKLTDSVRRKFYNGKENLDLADKKHKRSYFDLKQKHLVFEILTLNDHFRLKNVYYTIYENQPYLVVHISDCTTNSTIGQVPLYLTKIKEPISIIQSCPSTPFSIPENAEITVVVFNDNQEIYCSILDQIIKFYLTNNPANLITLARPSEAGGGVIVEGP